MLRIALPDTMPVHAQDTLASIGQPLNWIANLMVSTAFPLVFGALGRNTYLIFVALTAFFGWFTLTRVPETKGKTYEQVAQGVCAILSQGSGGQLARHYRQTPSPPCVGVYSSLPVS